MNNIPIFPCLAHDFYFHVINWVRYHTSGIKKANKNFNINIISPETDSLGVHHIVNSPVYNTIPKSIGLLCSYVKIISSFVIHWFQRYGKKIKLHSLNCSQMWYCSISILPFPLAILCWKLSSLLISEIMNLCSF